MKSFNFHGRKRSEALFKLRRSFVTSEELSWAQAREKGIPLDPRLQKAIEGVGPKLQKAVEGVGPRLKKAVEGMSPRIQIALDRMKLDEDLKLSGHSPNPLAVMVKCVPINSENIDNVLKEFNQARSVRRTKLDKRHNN